MRVLLPNVGVLLLVITFPLPTHGQATCGTIADVERKAYGFRPGKLSDIERERKSAAMDSFWSLVKRSGPAGSVCLESLLQKQEDGFAVFDEASLLHSLDHSAESSSIVAHAMARADLTDAVAADYIRLALVLAREGADIGPVAHNYLNSKADVTQYLVRHGGYRLDRTAGAILLYGVLPTDKIDHALSKEVNSDFSETRNSATMVWSLNLTEQSLKGLAALGAMSGFSDEAGRAVRHVLTPFEFRVTARKYTREQMPARSPSSQKWKWTPRKNSKGKTRRWTTAYMRPLHPQMLRRFENLVVNSSQAFRTKQWEATPRCLASCSTSSTNFICMQSIERSRGRTSTHLCIMDFKTGGQLVLTIGY